MEIRIRITPGTYLIWACMLLVLPVNLVIAALGSAMVHEMSHLLVIFLTGEKRIHIKINPLGAEIKTMELGRGQEALCSIAGPAGSLFLCFLVKCLFPDMALCALVQGVFNLLPAYPLDGGRLIRNLTSEAMAMAIQVMTLILLWGFGIWAGLQWNLGLLSLFPALAVTRASIPRKIPCKEPKLAVQ